MPPNDHLQLVDEVVLVLLQDIEFPLHLLYRLVDAQHLQYILIERLA